MVRNVLAVLAVLAGLGAGMVTNMALVMLNAYVLFPMPAGMDMSLGAMIIGVLSLAVLGGGLAGRMELKRRASAAAAA